MALPFDLNWQSPPPGTGVLAQPQTITNPLQSPLNPAPADAAVADARLKRNALMQMILKAQVLRETPGYAQGQGPLGARQGVGAGGWAQTLGDTVAGVMMAKAQQARGKEIMDAMAKLSPAENAAFAAQNALRRQADPNFISQGSTLSLSPLGLGNQ